MASNQTKIMFIISFLAILLALVIFAVIVWSHMQKTLHKVLVSPRIPMTSTPDKFGMDYKSFNVKVDGVKVSGWFMPGQKKAAILFVPGYMSEKSMYLPLAQAYHNEGFPIVLFDPRGEGESGGKYYALGAFAAQDVGRVIDFVTSNYGIKKYILLGFSCGATVAIISAARYSDRVVATIADSPFARISTIDPPKEYNKWLFKMLWPIYGWLGSKRIGVNMFQRLDAMDAAKKISHLFLIHCKKDGAVHWKNSQILYKQTNEPKEIWLLPDCNHVQAVQFHPKEYLKKTTDFIQRCLKETR